MLCQRCIRSFHIPPPRPITSLFRQTGRLPRIQNQSRPLFILSRLPSRPQPRISRRTALTAFGDTPTSSLFPLSQPSSQQVRTAIRNTYNPSHRVRKRRHGFLSRLRTRTGRRTLLRRRLKGRNTLSH